MNLSQDQYTELVLVQSRGAWHLAEAKGISAQRIEQLRNEIYSRMHQDERPLIAGVKEVLEQFYGKYIMGVVTSSRKEHFDLIHRSTNLLQYFDFVLTGEN